MESIIHPITGEKGFFISKTLALVIALIVNDYVDDESSTDDGRGVGLE